jgi:4-hydroxy-tetrahydrodipicolinate reductase
MTGGEIMRVILHGCNGKMGQVMARVLSMEDDMLVVAGVDVDPGKYENSFPVYSSLREASESMESAGTTADILVDFSHHAALDSLLDWGQRHKKSLLICTTGFTPEEKQRMVDASRKIPILHSSNMSLGVNLLLSLVEQAARSLGAGFDVEIVEKHHNQKADAPSGTALMIAEAVNAALGGVLELEYGRYGKTAKRKQNEIGLHSVRGGSIVGEHEVLFAGQGEVVEISHSALSRDVFAYGAVRAARYLVEKGPGLYSMRDVIRQD